MAVDLYELDAIRNYEKAIAALEGYADKIIDDFLEAPEGQSYIQANPDEEEYVGEWFLSILTLIYKTEVVTLPHITSSVLEPILTQTLPSTLSPDEAADAGSLIPELIAFWSYLQRAYRLSTAPNIIRCLRSIQPIFNALVLGDTSATKRSAARTTLRQSATPNSRVTDKTLSSLVHSLDALGDIDIDDLDEDDLKKLEADLGEFELEALDTDEVDNEVERHHLDYGDNGESHHHVGAAPLVDMDVDRGIKRPISKAGDSPNANASETISPEFTTVSSHIAASQVTPTAAEANLNGAVGPEDAEPSLENAIAPSLSDSSIATLTQQIIAADSPGTILHDFQVLLDAVGDKGMTVSGKTQYMPMKILADLNAKMNYSVRLGLKRPLQKAYPNIHGLCLVLKASGLGIVRAKGKKYWLHLQPALVAQWHEFNPTEKYFALLNAWMVRATSAMIGEPRDVRSVGEQCLQAWSWCFSHVGNGALSDGVAAERLGLMAGWHGLALMQLFGLVTLTEATPKAGQGWQVKQVARSPLGNAIMDAIGCHYYQNFGWRSEESATLVLSELQSIFQPYFPEWQQCLGISQPETVDGLYVFKVTLYESVRWIAISSDQSLFELSQTILDAVDFDHDHLDLFRYRLPSGGYAEVYHPYSQELPCSNEVLIRDLGLSVGNSLKYIFDFGDNWQFDVQVESIDEGDRRPNYAEVIRAEGTAPEQYPDPE